MARGKYAEWLTDEGLLKLEAWARNGLTYEQIAKNIGITDRTLYAWMKEYSPISQTLKKGREVVDIEVENALLKRALGYTYREVTYEEDNGELKKKKVVVKEVVPDTTAQIFWLKNRKPEDWRDKKNIEVSKPIDETIKEMEDYLCERVKKST